MNGRSVVVGIVCTMLLGIAALQAQEIPESARRHMVRGRTALELAKGAEELQDAASEFEQAFRLAPGWADAYFNHAAVKEKSGDIGGAVASYKRYLELAPNAEDANRVRDKVIALEYMVERSAKAANLAGAWSNGYEVTVQGDRFTARGPQRRFEGTISGSVIRGVFSREPVVDPQTGCSLPAEQVEFTGRVDDAGGAITFMFPEQLYRIMTQPQLFGGKACVSVEKTGTRPITTMLTRMEAGTSDGMVGMELKAIEDGGQVVRVIPGAPAEKAGIKPGDRILTVDGKDVRGLSTAELVRQVRGKAGTSVRVTVVREGGEPVEYTVVRESIGKGN